MPSEYFIFSSDLHGNTTQYELVVEHAVKASSAPVGVLFGGDIAPKCQFMHEEDYYGVMQREQRKWLKTLPRIFQPLRDRGIPVFIIIGNGDVSANYDLHLRHERKGFYHMVDGKRVPLTSKFDLVGYGFVPFSFSSMKDFEKWDVENLEPHRFQGQHETQFQSTQPRRQKFTVEEEESLTKSWQQVEMPIELSERDSIKLDLASTTFTAKPSKTVYMFHSPPSDCFADILPGDDHVGSKVAASAHGQAIRQFIEKHKPHMTLHGHIHGCVKMTGQFAVKGVIGSRTTVIASGNDPLYEQGVPVGKEVWVIEVDLVSTV